MKTLDLLLVARRFWPHSGLTELALVELTQNLVAAGHRVTVATFKWERRWSDRIHLGDIPVVRFARPLTGPWASYRYARVLSHHFAKQQYDAVIASGLGDEALAACSCLGDQVPVLLYVDDNLVGVSGKLHQRHVEVAMAADAVVADSDRTFLQLQSISGMPAATVIEPGFNQSVRSTFEKKQARHALGIAHPVIRIDAGQKLVLAVLHERSSDGVMELIEAWRWVVKAIPDAKLWLLGECRGLSNIWQRIVELELSYSILLPGFFDDWSEVFSAADLFVHTGGIEQSGAGLIRAQLAAVPAIALKNDVTNDLIDPDVSGCLLPGGSTKLLADSIVDALKSPAAGLYSSSEHLTKLANRFAAVRQVRQYVQLIEQLERSITGPA